MFVNTSLDVALERNKLEVINPEYIVSKSLKCSTNMGAFQRIFEPTKMLILIIIEMKRISYATLNTASKFIRSRLRTKQKVNCNVG